MDLVTLDEFGYLPFYQAGGFLLIDLFSKLYECTNEMITTHLAGFQLNRHSDSFLNRRQQQV